jgi:hypothetical protein
MHNIRSYPKMANGTFWVAILGFTESKIFLLLSYHIYMNLVKVFILRVATLISKKWEHWTKSTKRFDLTECDTKGRLGESSVHVAPSLGRV